MNVSTNAYNLSTYLRSAADIVFSELLKSRLPVRADSKLLVTEESVLNVLRYIATLGGSLVDPLHQGGIRLPYFGSTMKSPEIRTSK